MAFTEEVFENMGKRYGAHTGKEYSKGETEEKGVGRWSKPSHCAPGELVLEVGEKDGNGRGKVGY